MSHAPEDRFVQVQGTQIRYRQAGAGPRVFMIHGLPGTLEDWQPLWAQLADTCQLVAIDRPGHGQSGTTMPHTLEQNAAVALGVIERLGLTDVTVVGHSYGGATAVALAVQNPAAVRAVVALAAPSLPEPAHRIEPPMHLARVPLLGDRIIATFSPLLGPKMVARGIRAAFHPNDAALPPGFIERNQRIWLSAKVSVTTAQEKVGLAASQRRLVHRYASIEKKLVLVHGNEDRLVPTEHSKGLHRLVPTSELILLDGVGHYIQFARPEELAEIVRAAAG
jgi:pimeloyl-ACP methyl ester carboxylesterase